MPTLTQLEEVLRQSDGQAEKLLTQLIATHHRLQKKLKQSDSQNQYQQITLLLELVIQAEDVIKEIYFRYHNQPMKIETSKP